MGLVCRINSGGGRLKLLRLLMAVVAGTYAIAAAGAGWDGRFEQLRFRISWWLLPGAEALMQATPAPGAGAEFRIQACTNPALDLFHKVRDSITARAWRTGTGFRAMEYREDIREGRYRNRIGISFPLGGPAVLMDHDAGQSQSIVLPPNALDLVTAFYVVRSLDLEVGERYQIPVIDNDQSYDLSIEVLAAEVRSTYLGERTPTVIIRPLLLTKGVFKRDGAMRIWLTDDDRHLPVHLETKITVGRIHADLIGLSHDADDRMGETLFCESR